MVDLSPPGTEPYDDATQPHNASSLQRPAFVARPTSADEVAAVVRECAARGLTAMPQATGHGAGGEVGPDTVIVDTSGLDSLSIDTNRRVATAGAGLTWSTVNTAAWQHGLLGLAGSAPTVCISGYTFGGGIGWLSRPHGMASAALRRVQYVDGHGDVREASDDATDEIDREAMWAYRGGGGVGIATSLEFDLVDVLDLHAGYLLWPVDALDAVVGAWAQAMAAVGDDVATSISVLRAPPAPPFPDELQGTQVVHLAVAASTGAAGAQPLLAAVRGAVVPTVDTWGPADVGKLVGIHLDPPSAVPAIGDARWLGPDLPAHAAAILRVAAAPDSPLAMTELRSVGNAAVGPDGAETTAPGPYIVHAVGAPSDATSRQALNDTFAAVQGAAAPVDVGRSVGSWMEGATSVPDALPANARARVLAAAERVDPDGVIRRSRFLT